MLYKSSTKNRVFVEGFEQAVWYSIARSPFLKFVIDNLILCKSIQILPIHENKVSHENLTKTTDDRGRGGQRVVAFADHDLSTCETQ